MKGLDWLAGWLYDVLNRKGNGVNRQVRGDLSQLYPGENLEVLCRRYGVRKLQKSFVIVFAGAVLAGVLAVRAEDEREIKGNEIPREELSGEAMIVELETVLEGKSEQFEIEMQPIRMTDDELQSSYQEFCETLPGLIMGENESLNRVTKDLRLLESYEGYPFLLEWRSDTSDCVSSSGVVAADDVAQEVHLRALISYEEQEWEEVLTVCVPAQIITPEERRHNELEKELIFSQEATRTNAVWTLPQSYQDTELQWRRVVEDNSMLLWAGALVVSVVVYWLGDKDLHQKIEERREHMKREYADVVHKLALYLGAGMTLQGAFRKLAAEYEQRKTPAYEEMLYTCRELEAGVPESKAYERFGKRTGVQEYIRLSTLLTQNLKKGSSSLLSRLQEEADRALAERIRSGRKLGEEASTKLLIPMVMMLAVVMVMVMLPALSSMGL